MTDQNTQPVADVAEVAPVAQTEVTGAQNDTPDLDTLLKEFETAKPEPKPEPKPQASDPVVAELQREVATMKFQREIEPILSRVRGDLPKDVLSDEELTDLLDGRAKRDPRVASAYLNRANNPSAWAKIEKALNSELTKKFTPRVDKNATDDRIAVAAAVRAASTKAPDEKPPSYAALSNPEYRQKVKEQYGFDPGV